MPPASSSSAGRYVKEAELGSGTYGVVYMAKDRLTGGTVAIKRMNVSTEEEGVPATTIREVCLLKELQHPNIVSMYDVTFQAPKLTLVFEYCEYDLKKFMDSKRTKTLDIQTEVKCLLKQLLLGLEYMHSRHVVHRDLKPQNLLMNANLQLKIADFGLARVEGIPVKKYSHEAVTLWYRPPDVILGSTNYGFVVDMWSVGCIFAEMIVGKPVFNGHNDAEQLLKIYKLLGSPTPSTFPHLHHYPNMKQVYQSSKNNALDETYPSTFDEYVRNTDLHKLGPHGLDLLKKMLQYDPAQRITAADALAHPFLAGYEVQYLLPNTFGSSASNSPSAFTMSSVSSSNGLSTGGSHNSSGNHLNNNNNNNNNSNNNTVRGPQDPTRIVQMQAVLDAIDVAIKHQQQQEVSQSDLNYNSVTAGGSSTLNASTRMVPTAPTNPRSTISFAPQ